MYHILHMENLPFIFKAAIKLAVRMCKQYQTIALKEGNFDSGQHLAKIGDGHNPLWQ